jgi:hypothetical protein
MGIQQLSLILSKSFMRQGLLQILCFMRSHLNSPIATALEERLEERFLNKPEFKSKGGTES